jgi:hypothetical protein
LADSKTVEVQQLIAMLKSYQRDLDESLIWFCDMVAMRKAGQKQE